MDGITLITPTSDRPVAFQLCQRWMKRAIDRFGRDRVQWIIADDGRQPARCTMGQQHIRRPPAETVSASFRGNLVAALRKVAYETVLFIEDDDWYEPDYLNAMARLLEDGVQIAGEARSKYYNIRTRHYLCCRNQHHASLCQTGISSRLIPWLRRRLQRQSSTFIDLDLWQQGAKAFPRHLRPESELCIGIKGLPGKQGIGIGHRLDDRHRRDPEGEVLRSWIGDDAEVYFNLVDHA